MVLDRLKVASTDSYYNEEHILFLLKKYRAVLLEQKYKDTILIPENNYQEVCLDLEYKQINCNEGVLKSVKPIPDIIKEDIKVYTNNEFSSMVSYISPDRFKFVGLNKYLKNIIYVTKGNGNYIYVKSTNSNVNYLKQIKIKAVFEDIEEAAKLSCSNDSGEGNCDIMEVEFPLEDALVPTLIDTVVKTFSPSIMTPQDTTNDANDDLGDLNNYVRRNLKSSVAKQLDQE